jgi:predicted nucleic acid-binding protein
MSFYLDSSALIKLIYPECESASLRRFLHGDLFTSILARLEVERFLTFGSASASTDPSTFQAFLNFVSINDLMINKCLALNLPRFVRTLDAIHLGTAVSITKSTSGVITYDKKMQRACRVLGMKFYAPGQRTSP